MDNVNDGSEPAPRSAQRSLRARLREAIPFLPLVGLGTIVAFVGFLMFHNTREAIQREACQENLKKWGAAFRMYAEANQGKWPTLDPSSANLLFPLKSVYPEYVSDPSIFVCPSDSAARGRLREESKGGNDADVYYAKSSYVYLGYAIEDENQGLALVMALRGTLSSGMLLPEQLGIFPGYNSGTQQKFLALKEGIERFFITDINGPGGSQREQSMIPVMFEPVCWHGDRVNVLYMDGHVESMRPDDARPSYRRFHTSRKFLTALRELQESRLAISDGSVVASEVSPAVTDASAQFAALVRGLKNDNPFVRAAAAGGLESVASLTSEAVEALAQNLRDFDGTARVVAARALAHGTSAGDAAAVCKGIHAVSPRDTQRPLAEILLRGAPLQWGLADLLKHGDAEVRAGAADLIGFSASAQLFVSLLTETLSDESPEVRRAAARALAYGSGIADNGSAVSALTATLKDSDAEVRLASAQALEKYHAQAESASGALSEALHDPSARVAARAAMALSWIRPDDPALAPRLLAIADSKDDLERAGVAAALGRVADKSKKNRAALLRLLGDSKYDVQVNALRSLTRYPLDSGIFEAVIAQVGRTDPPVSKGGFRHACREAGTPLREEIGLLAEFHDPKVIPILTQALTSWDTGVARNAKLGLQSLGQ